MVCEKKKYFLFGILKYKYFKSSEFSSELFLITKNKKLGDDVMGYVHTYGLTVFVNPKVHHLSIEKYTTLSKKIIAPSATFQFL